MRLVIASDAWLPQVNGVVTTLTRTVDTLRQRGHSVLTITPDMFRTIACPTYHEIELALCPGRRIRREIEEFNPDAVHICTEGPVGFAARRFCVKRRVPFTTSLHTRFPEYIRMRCGMPLWVGYKFLRWFHNAAAQTMVATPHLMEELRGRGIEHMAIWSRGVDLQMFRPEAALQLDLPRPIFVNMGRVAVEKNIRAFLDLDLPGSKMVIGAGPDLEQLRRDYPKVVFTGVKRGDELAGHLAAADVFVFPSKTDTFGLVMLEANACGLPVAAYPVRGPLDVVDVGVSGVLDEDLGRAATRALELSPEPCRAHAGRFSWDRCTDQFIRNLNPLPDDLP